MPNEPECHSCFFYKTVYQDGITETNLPSHLEPHPRAKEIAEILHPSVLIPRQLTCKRCNASWAPRKKKLPVQCPKCHSPYWNRERIKHS